MSKKKTAGALNAPKQITDKIPYLCVYEEEGMFETAPGVFSKSYVIEDISPDNLKNYSNEIVAKRFALLLNDIPSNMNIQFVIHNRLIPQEAFLKKVLAVQTKEEEINEWIEKYNDTVVENSTIGHNNVKKNKYFVVSQKADCPEDAATAFRLVDEQIKKLFAGIYGIQVNGLSVPARLKVLYSMFNPKGSDFGKKADLRGDGVFKLENMKKLRLTTKDCVAPVSFDTMQKNYMVLNGDTYVRSFFITSVPAVMSNNLISDITNISSSMIFSAFYEAVDSKRGFEAATEAVVNNTIVKKKNKRDTIKDRKDKATVEVQSMINENEKAYFERAALETFKESVAAGEKTMLCSFVIVLYADDLETLDRDTKLLHISTSKFACQVKSLDLQQLKGFQSALPLGSVYVDIKRMLTVQKLSSIPPLNIQEVLQRDGQFYGLNSINDNLILLNRKNGVNLAGIIAGTEHSGKTFQNKREIFNALMSTNDKVVVVTDGNEYDGFVKTLGGQIVDIQKFNPYEMVEHYGLVNPDGYSKSLMLEALLEAVTRPNDKNISTSADKVLSMYELNETEDDETRRISAIASEVEDFLKVSETDGVMLNDFEEVSRYVSENAERFPLLASMQEHELIGVNTAEEERSRLILYKTNGIVNTILLLDHLWNNAIRDKMASKSNWLFVDPVDSLFSSEQSSSFLIDQVEKNNALKTVSTFVVQSSIKLFADSQTSFRYEDFVNVLGYFKLLNQGAIERKKYTEILNISNSLVNYITSAELGKGIIMTTSSNVAFNDSFLMEEGETVEDSFYSLFKI